ncbi:hypothetical protein [Flavobacterium anhuiense]|uniref:hypothetical protein n=1 Tax=Flavobacterium anhuiense TaxID=459526 RepID=UPI00202706D0|nr:hypothetical protein [Flavobacterium anhuiense]URM37539.1 hypothetical protein LLY39_02920 [Flavobacterium anhuiense]
MKRILLTIAFITFFNSFIHSQATKFTYIQFDITASITGNPDKDDSYYYPKSTSSNAFFVPNGLGAKIGYGVHYKKWLTLGLHSGLDWKWDDKLVAVPVFLNLGLSPKVGPETRIMLQAGYGKGFALGRGNLNGAYKRAKLGIGSDDFIIFAEISDYAFPLYDQKSIGTISFGVTLTDFFHYNSQED